MLAYYPTVISAFFCTRNLANNIFTNRYHNHKLISNFYKILFLLLDF